MKAILAAFLLVTGFRVEARVMDTIPVKDSAVIQVDNISIQKDTIVASDSTSSKPLYNKYGDLLNDAPIYNPKYSWLIPASWVLSSNAFLWAVDKYIFKFDWASSVTGIIIFLKWPPLVLGED